MSECFETSRTFFGWQLLMTTAYHLHTSEKAERFNENIFARLGHYVAEHQPDWDLFVQILAYAYYTQGHRQMGTTAFSLVLLRKLPGPNAFVTPTALSTDIIAETSPRALRIRLLSKISVTPQNAEMRK